MRSRRDTRRPVARIRMTSAQRVQLSRGLVAGRRLTPTAGPIEAGGTGMVLRFGRRSVSDVLLERISRHPEVSGGRPMVGDDVPVERVLDLLAAGISPEAILLAHPGLEV